MWVIVLNWLQISIHAPHEGERRSRLPLLIRAERFQSTLPTRGSEAEKIVPMNEISQSGARSPRGGASFCGRGNFLPYGSPEHAPHEGERQCARAYAQQHNRVRSTLPTRGSESPACRRWVWRTGPEHAPHEGERRALYTVIRRSDSVRSTLPTRGSDQHLQHFAAA